VADVDIISPASSTAPKTYTLPGAQELLLKAVRATVDGTGAAASFVPALQMLDPNGNVMWTAVGGTAIAAGTAVNVTWFSGLGSTTSTDIVGGQIIQTYWGGNPAADFNWNVGGTVTTTMPTNSTFTKLLDNTYLSILYEGDFTAGAAADNISLGVWLNGGNRINVAVGTVGAGSFSSVNGSIVRNIPGDPVSFPAGAYTVQMKVSSFVGQATTFRCAAAATLSIVEIGPV